MFNREPISYFDSILEAEEDVTVPAAATFGRLGRGPRGFLAAEVEWYVSRLAILGTRAVMGSPSQATLAR